MTRRCLLALALALAACQAGPGPATVPPDSPREQVPVGEARDRYGYLPDRGRAADTARGILDLERGYYSGDLVLEGTGLEKRGAGIGESVIDGHVEVRGHGWTLIGFTIRGDLTVVGDRNDVRQVKVLGRLTLRGEDNRPRNEGDR
ncbi:MAG: hypothetical protein R3F62_21095 [Planctomycetota bacterium]